MDLFRHGREVVGFSQISLDAGPEPGQPCIGSEAPPRSGATECRWERCSRRVGGRMNGAAFGISIGILAILSLIIIQRILDNPNSYRPQLVASGPPPPR